MQTTLKLTDSPGEKPQVAPAVGTIFTDHMFVTDYGTEKCLHGKILNISRGKIGKISAMLYDELTGIRFGTKKDELGWSY